jgi:mono/diheme cytochrome c family protein
MKRWIVIGLAVLAGMLVVAAAVVATGAALAERKRERVVDVPRRSVALPADAASIDRGRYLYGTRGCSECHGADGAGRVFIDSPGLRVKAPNISPGPGSVVAGYAVEDWDRAIRHGVKRDGRPLFVMPSEDYARLTDADLGALVAHLKQMPPAAGGPLEARVPLPVRVLYGLGLIRDAAEKIDHTLPSPEPVAEGVTPQWGAYVAQACQGCHGKALEGGRIPGGPPDWPPAADLRPGGALARYANADAFVNAMRTGKRPDGSTISPVMPFPSFAAMNETDLRALFAYLRSIGAKTGT